VNVFIGENSCGEWNILEALMFASVAETYRTIDANILYTNGIRVSKPTLMLSSFSGRKQSEKIEINLEFDNTKFNCLLAPENADNILSKWIKVRNSDNPIKDIEFSPTTSDNYNELTNFIIYTLNTEALRGIATFQKNMKGIYGETLDLIISQLSKSEMNELKEYLYTISWIQDFFIDKNDELKQNGYKLNFSKSVLYFRDKYMMKKNNVFSSENSNEGILHILFYLANIISSKMPRLFGIDNIETSLNPHLCQHIMLEICKLAKIHDKQLLITTHNPAILDGLNLFDDEVRLFEVFRTDNGDTRTRRIKFKPSVEGEQFKLSELWTRGFLGAISEKF